MSLIEDLAKRYLEDLDDKHHKEVNGLNEKINELNETISELNIQIDVRDDIIVNALARNFNEHKTAYVENIEKYELNITLESEDLKHWNIKELENAAKELLGFECSEEIFVKALNRAVELINNEVSK